MYKRFDYTLLTKRGVRDILFLMDILSVNLNLLKSFRAVYKTGGINKGAKFLGVVTPAVAYNIKQLEKQLGHKLFITHKKGVDPTNEASNLYPLVESAFENLLKYNEQFGITHKGTVRIGLTTIHVGFFFIKFMQQFRDKYPDIKVDFYHHPQHDYLTMLENNEIDIAIHLLLKKPTEQMQNFAFQRLPMTFFVTKKFATEHNIEHEITLEQLTKLPLIIFSMQKTSSVLAILENHYHSQFKTIAAPSTQAAYDMAINGYGVGYFYKDYLDAQNNDQIIRLRLKDAPEPPLRAYDCAYNKNPSAIETLFLKELKDFFKS